METGKITETSNAANEFLEMPAANENGPAIAGPFLLNHKFNHHNQFCSNQS